MPQPRKTDKTIKGLNSTLSTKICLYCNRPFQYRKKWKDVWSEVRFCSLRCKGLAKKGLEE